MNNTIFRRKFVLGVLIAFVLGFGVQGVAEAVLTASKVSGDHQDKIFTQDFDFRFSISGVDTADGVTDSITITVSAGSLRVGSKSATGTTFTLTEGDDNATDNQSPLNNGTIFIRCNPTGAGLFTVTVNPVSPSTGFTNLSFTGYGIQRPEDIDAQTFVDSSDTANLKTGIGFDSPQNEYGADPTVAVTLTDTPPENAYWVYVDLSVNDPGRLYRDLDEDGRPDASPQNRLRVFTNGSGVTNNVKLQMNGGTNKVTASIKDATDETHVITYFYQSVQLNRVSGNGQAGRPATLLAEPLVVLVADSRGAGISGQAVTFSATTGTLVRIPSYVRVGTTGNVILTDSNGHAKINYVLPDTEGVQTVTAGFDRNNDGTADDPSVPFTVTSNNNAVITTPIRQPSGNNLSISPLSITATAGSTRSVTVNANRNGIPVQLNGGQGLTVLETGTTGTPISFTIPGTTATGGYRLTASTTAGYNSASIPVTVQGAQTNVAPSLSRSSISGAPNAVIDVNVTLSGAPTGTRVDIGAPFNVFERTNSSGVASFRLRLPASGSGNASVSATSYTSRVAQLSYNVTGTTTGTQVRLVLGSGASSQLTGAAGTNVQLRVRVTNTAGTAGVNGVSVTFSSNNVDLATRTSDASGNVVVTYTVQTTAQTVTAVINDSNVDSTGASSITFTITPGTGQQPSRLSIIQTNNAGRTSNIGAPGVSHTIQVLLPDRGAGQRVILDVVRNSDQVNVGTYVLSSDVAGTAVTPDTFRLPTAAGTYTITATAGTNTATATLTVFAIRLLKDSSDSVSGDNQEGDRGEVLDDPFTLRVVQDSDGTAVQGVPVTFTVTDGDGELSTSSSATSGSNTLTVDSDSNGDVEVYLVLDEDDEDNEVRASVGITGVSDVTFTATGALVPYDLEIVSGNNQRIAVNQFSDPMRVRVTDEDGNDLEGVTVTFSMRGPGGTLTPRSAETDRIGEAEAELLPRAAGTFFVDARVVGVPTVRFTITVGDLADDIEIVSGNNQRGDPGTELADPLVVEVLDEDGDVVSGVAVTFSVTAGGGSLSDTSVDTNSRGRAQTYLTLGDEPGRNSVRASVSGVSTTVTFAATAVDPTPPEPVIHLGSGQRVDTYWINTDSGTLHRLVGSSVENIASGVTNVVSLAVTSNRLYWVETTGNNSGRLRRSNLNGTNIQLIRDLTATPAGITVDTANSKIYLTNGFGKVQSINLDGSGYAPNLITGLTNPTDIAVGGGKVYWITGGGTVHSANVDGTGVTQIAGGYSALGSIAVGGGKVFWTETISESDGNIHSANLDGSSVTEVVSLLAAPYGISVDASANKLYFTNSRGRLMQSNLNGGSIKIVASNLVALGDVSVPSGPATRPPGTFSRYDVNRDGKVDNTDAALVANALGESPPSDPNLDVNGDGNVNFLDLLLVFDNRDESNAAPVAVASERPKVSPEEVQHQIDLLLATDNHSVTAQFTLAYLQSLLEVVTPEKTRLLANYPNPFNPETWIPYQLAASSKVQITIYNSAGKEVRTLSLGHQSEGYYTDRSRAAYWDGRNAIGEQVASGVYFYTLITDRMSATRKMLILK